jgi:uncharacterized membrane protein YdbT with pleckstrin-like domain
MKRVYLTLLAAWFTMISFAQEHKVDIDINKNEGGGSFFMSPVVWIVGGAIFILLLVALLRGRSSD